MERSTESNVAIKADASELRLLFLATCPLCLWVLHGSVAVMLSAMVLFILFALAVWLIHEGSRIAAAHDAAEVARRPSLPRKLLGALLVGLVALILAADAFGSFMAGTLCGAIATCLCIASYGLDPLRDKGAADPARCLRQRGFSVHGTAEDAFAELAARVGALDDSELIDATVGAGHRVTRLLAARAQDPEAMRPLLVPLTKLLGMAQHEADRLIDDWSTPGRAFARRRYIAKFEAMAGAFEARASRQRGAIGRDRLDCEADLLLDRMVRESAA